MCICGFVGRRFCFVSSRRLWATSNKKALAAFWGAFMGLPVEQLAPVKCIDTLTQAC